MHWCQWRRVSYRCVVEFVSWRQWLSFASRCTSFRRHRCVELCFATIWFVFRFVFFFFFQYWIFFRLFICFNHQNNNNVNTTASIGRPYAWAQCTTMMSTIILCFLVPHRYHTHTNRARRLRLRAVRSHRRTALRRTALERRRDTQPVCGRRARCVACTCGGACGVGATSQIVE